MSAPEDVELVEAPEGFFAEAAREAAWDSNSTEWLQTRLGDGSTYLRWSGVFECLISADAGRVTACRTADVSYEALLTYLLSEALSFALLKKGFDPLHGTAVMVDGGVVGFLGDSGYGKSSLAAAFLQAGYRIVTDDLLVVAEQQGGLWVYPGIPRLKLFPEIAEVFLGPEVVGIPMNPLTRKLVIPLDSGRCHLELAPLSALYVLTRPSKHVGSTRVTIRSLPKRLGFIGLVRNAFNTLVVDPARLRQQLSLNAHIASTIPIKMLSYPRTIAAAPSARDAILADLGCQRADRQ